MQGHDEAQTEGFSALYGQLLKEFADQIGEKEAPYGSASRSVREEIVRCVWFGGRFPKESLTTDEGQRIEVLSPGWWNVAGGPDFVRAEFLLENAGRVVGDVEVHTFASAWYSHGHHRQHEYDDVALHVVMWNDRQEPTVGSANGGSIPQLTLSAVLSEDVEELVEVIDPAGETEGPAWPALEGRYCGRAYRDGEMAPDWLGRLLDAAGDHRILARAAALAELFQNHSREQLLYERIAEALGYKNNRMPFLQLAGLLPISMLRGMVPEEAAPGVKSRMLEAAFLIVGGFVKGLEPPHSDPETVAYREGLLTAWGELGAQLPTTRLSREHWQFGGVRPVNHPARRLAALARLCAEHLHTGLFQHFARVLNTDRPSGRQRPGTAVRTALTGTFSKLPHPYWSRRYTLGGKRLVRPRALVGKERALGIVVDVLLPMLLAHAQVEGEGAVTGRLHMLWRGIPRRQDNAVTRRMGQVIFADAAESLRVVTSARRQQGLHQLYRDACRGEKGCERCVLYLAHRSGKTLALQ